MLSGIIDGVKSAVSGQGNDLIIDKIVGMLPEKFQEQAKTFLDDNLSKVLDKDNPADVSVITNKLSEFGADDEAISKITELVGGLTK